jgi:hypothetical protein
MSSISSPGRQHSHPPLNVTPDAWLNGVMHDQAGDMDGAGLAHAVDAANRLHAGTIAISLSSCHHKLSPTHSMRMW